MAEKKMILLELTFGLAGVLWLFTRIGVSPSPDISACLMTTGSVKRMFFRPFFLASIFCSVLLNHFFQNLFPIRKGNYIKLGKQIIRKSWPLALNIWLYS